MSAAPSDPVRAGLERFLGRRLGPYNSFNPVNRAQIWQWCTAMGDSCARYLGCDDGEPGDNATGTVAPLAMMQMWTMRNADLCYAPGSTAERPYVVLDHLVAQGFGSNVAVSYELRFLRQLREGDRAHHFTTIVDISDRKSTGLGEGYFLTELVNYLDQDEQAFAEARISYFAYRPAKSSSEPVPARESPVAKETGDATEAQPPTRNTPPRAGDVLPKVCIPITATQIVAGAIASQDFEPVHHDHAAARAAGMPDIFMNILTTCGLAARYLTAWSGSDSFLKRMQFKLLAPNLPGDRMTMSGTVVDVRPDLTTVEFRGDNRLGCHVSGSASIQFTSPADRQSP